jgi:hypothetical protein
MEFAELEGTVDIAQERRNEAEVHRAASPRLIHDGSQDTRHECDFRAQATRGAAAQATQEAAAPAPPSERSRAVASGLCKASAPGSDITEEL